MSDAVEPENPPVQQHIAVAILGILRRPIEYGLTGAALVGVLFMANETDILPKVFKGAGFEVEFQERVVQNTTNTNQSIDLLKKQVSTLQASVSALREELGQQPLSAAAAEEVKAPEVTTDKVASENSLVDKSTRLQTQGFMWIGTYDAASKTWTDKSATLPNHGPLPPPEEMKGSTLNLSTTVNIRDALPAKDASYFRGVRALGIAETGTNVTVLSVPQPYNRDTGVQYWGQVDVAILPYIGVQQSQ